MLVSLQDPVPSHVPTPLEHCIDPTHFNVPSHVSPSAKGLPLQVPAPVHWPVPSHSAVPLQTPKPVFPVSQLPKPSHIPSPLHDDVPSHWPNPVHVPLPKHCPPIGEHPERTNAKTINARIPVCKIAIQFLNLVIIHKSSHCQDSGEDRHDLNRLPIASPAW